MRGDLEVGGRWLWSLKHVVEEYGWRIVHASQRESGDICTSASNFAVAWTRSGAASIGKAERE